MASGNSALAAFALVAAFLVVYISFSYSHAFAATAANPGSTTAIAATNGTGGAHVAVSLQQEINNSAQLGYNLTLSMFNATDPSECSKQLITFCDNNVPSQFVCVNQQSVYSVATQRGQIENGSGPQACPLFILDGNVSCGVQDGYCVVTESGPMQNRT